MKLKKIIFPFWGYSLGILVFVLLVKFGFISTTSMGISVSSLEIVLIIYALVLGLIQVARQTTRLKSLSAIATDLGNGRLDKRSNDLNFDSIGNLAHAFNKMADQMQKSFGDLSEVRQNLEAQNDELHEVLKTEARFGAYLESISTVDTQELSKRGLRSFQEITGSPVGWLVYFDAETRQQLCFRNESHEFRGMPDVPYVGNMYEVSQGNQWTYQELHDDSVEDKRGKVLLIPFEFDGKPLGVILLEVRAELEGREKQLLGNYVEAFSNAFSNCISYQTALRQSIRMEEINKELLLADQNRSNFVARMSHELRTPLNSIIGFSKIMEKNKPGNLT
jgi:nitrate/nitrite-specific signal transduction histidine kinase